MSYFVNMIYVIVSFTLTDNFLIRLSAKEILEVSYKKFDTLVSFDIYMDNRIKNKISDYDRTIL
jgi:hypothetical protein